ncbi:Vps51/Vps67-domain-containing protein [Mucidula mucida]|nr:Vps51/Vps67-domain-containing protein [Mucidula mucida]
MASSPSRRASIPRPPPSPSPLRPGSPPVIPSGLTPQSSSPGTLSPRRVTPTSPPKTRARDLLRKHYGLAVGPPPPTLGASTDPMNMDSPAFDAKAYYEQLITTSNLPALLKQENELVSEIRELDSERQALVYNHHHELIAASDTIAAVKTRAESLDADLDLLKAAFSEISRLAEEVTMDNRPS